LSPLPHILTVDDSKGLRLFVQQALAGFACDHGEAANGYNAFFAIERTRPDLILLDLSMPVMDGLEATRRIRRMDGPASQTPIVALTADIDPELEDRAREAGVSQLAAKPIDPPRLRDIANRWAQHKKQAAE